MKDDLQGLELDEEDIIDFNEFAEEKTDDLNKTFVFVITDGCPICGGEVKGNDHLKYFCKKCNLLFDKKDIIDDEWNDRFRGAGAVRKTKLSEEELAALEKKKKELKDRVFSAFSDEQKEELVEAAEELPVEEELDSSAEEEVDTGEEEEPIERSVDLDAVTSALGGGTVEAEFEDIDEDASEEVDETAEEVVDEEPQETYELEEAGTIIASKESTKIHSGQCHFVKKIHPENRIYYDSIADAQDDGYEMCVCLRRMKARGEIE